MAKYKKFTARKNRSFHYWEVAGYILFEGWHVIGEFGKREDAYLFLRAKREQVRNDREMKLHRKRRGLE
jgi:hypothetical protein